MSLSDAAGDYARIAQAIEFLRARRQTQPSLAELAAHIGLSPSHTQRLFSRWAGISPKRFVQFLTVEYAKRRMAETGDLIDLALDSGLSGPGRLHDLFVGLEGLSPGEYKQAARDLTITYGLGPSPFGLARVAFSARGICHLAFADDRLQVAALREQWPQARLQHDDEAAADLLACVFKAPDRAPPGLSLWVSGTNFQIQVWRALMRVPFAGLLSYRQLAQAIGKPGAARAVGSAVARNPVAYLIPCHRVLRESGEFGEYHWGSERKVALCGWEAALQQD